LGECMFCGKHIRDDWRGYFVCSECAKDCLKRVTETVSYELLSNLSEAGKGDP